MNRRAARSRRRHAARQDIPGGDARIPRPPATIVRFSRPPVATITMSGDSAITFSTVASLPKRRVDAEPDNLAVEPAQGMPERVFAPAHLRGGDIDLAAGLRLFFE